MQCEPIGVVRSPRTDPANTTGWGSVIARIELFEQLGEQSLVGLAGYSHIDVVFWFDQITPRSTYAGLQRPRNRADLPLVGVFAARGPHRPNPIGVSACPIVEVHATWLSVSGLDAVDGTPVLDLKPVMAELLPEAVMQPEWSRTLMSGYFV